MKVKLSKKVLTIITIIFLSVIVRIGFEYVKATDLQKRHDLIEENQEKLEEKKKNMISDNLKLGDKNNKKQKELNEKQEKVNEHQQDIERLNNEKLALQKELEELIK